MDADAAANLRELVREKLGDKMADVVERLEGQAEEARELKGQVKRLKGKVQKLSGHVEVLSEHVTGLSEVADAKIGVKS